MPTTNPADIDQTVAELKSETTLAQALDSLREMTHANLVVYWDDLALAGVQRDTPVNLQLWDTTLGRAIGILISLAGGDGSVSYTVKDGIILVGSPDRFAMSEQTSTRIYDVRDLVDEVIRYSNLKRPAQPVTIGAGGAGAQPYVGMSGDDAEQMLSDMIQEHVSKDSWKDNGGSAGALRAFAGRLVITQTPDAHRRIKALLHILRAGGGKDGIDIHKVMPTTSPAH
jgi:hypothetical protein